MDKRDGLEAAKKLMHRRGEHIAPSVGEVNPEVRTPIKWKQTIQDVPSPFRLDAFELVIWKYGVPFDQIEGFNNWLAANEIQLAGLCDGATDGKVNYLGTYLNVDTDAPRYQTFWGLRADDALHNTEGAEQALTQALATTGTLQDLVATLRSYWVRDANATDQRYGLARHFLHLESVADDGFWAITRMAVQIPPVDE
jgi:hypothetical protein